eukprot:CAMPEP_0115557234 /NCGR_PEP_ID=MMETSP0271-20121206/98803_1 /TAXON_ID=71861 /ORGANISM="Scrippsiella trochoidea, Strain CCMP3099" /LENGTH=154 /DNA_ID=CAMNT_0002991183 /DNA_START=29 /DNA_END=490 /DNA_ORIENTATION=-
MVFKSEEARLDYHMKLLRGVPLFRPIINEDIQELAKAMVELHFKKGEALLQQGDSGGTFYILRAGSANVLKDGKVVKSLKVNFTGNDVLYFEERALVENQVQEVTVIFTSDAAEVLALDRESFELTLGPLQEITSGMRARRRAITTRFSAYGSE